MENGRFNQLKTQLLNKMRLIGWYTHSEQGSLDSPTSTSQDAARYHQQFYSKKYRLLENYRSEKFENSEYNVEIKTHCVHEDGVWQS